MNRLRLLVFVLVSGSVLPTVGCSPYLKTKEIKFYRQQNVTEGRPVAVDVVYPRSIEERDKIMKIGPGAWFTDDLAGQVQKDKPDVPAGQPVTVPLTQRAKKKTGIVVIAEFGERAKDSTASAGEEPMVFLDQYSSPKARATEVIQIFPGYMKRVKE